MAEHLKRSMFPITCEMNERVVDDLNIVNYKAEMDTLKNEIQKLNNNLGNMEKRLKELEIRSIAKETTFRAMTTSPQISTPSPEEIQRLSLERIFDQMKELIKDSSTTMTTPFQISTPSSKGN
ncbi:uncharacterized protein LOC144420927 [Styela clava]